jgi:hypothetical protein
MVLFLYQVVISLKGKSRSIISFAAILYLIISCVCFDVFKTDALARPLDVQQKSAQIFIESCGSIREDVCTVEMLGSAQAILFCQQAVVRNSEIFGKSEWLFGDFMLMALQQRPLQSFLSVNPSICANKGDLTAVIYFIHNKDGKKKI